MCPRSLPRTSIGGHTQVDLQVKLRKTAKRIPLVVNFQEILAILARLEDRYRLIAEVQ